MPDPLLTLLKYVFLAVLYLFFLRVLRAVWIELREPKPGTADFGGPVAAPVAPSFSGPQQLGPERLVLMDPGDRKGVEFPLGEELTVGRAPGCGVSLPDDTFVSQLHARVFRRGADLYVEDLGSTNGTYLNDRKVTSAVPMRKGDRVQFGKTTLELRK